MYICPVCDQQITDNNILYSSPTGETQTSIDITCGNHYEGRIELDSNFPGEELLVETWYIGRYRIDINRSDPIWICIYDKMEYHASGVEILQADLDEMPKFKTEEDIQNWIMIS